MANPAGETTDGALKLDFDRRLMLQFRGSVVTSDAGLLAYRELDDALGLSAAAGETLTDARTGKNGRHALVGLLRQSVFGRLAGYEDVNDAERLRHDPAMRSIIGGKAAEGLAASPSQMGRFETRWLTAERNLCALAESDIFTVYGYSAAQTMVALLKQCGDNLTRENVMKQAASIHYLNLPMLLPGITVSTSADDFAPIKQMQLMKFDGTTWRLFGDVISASGN
jgi:hypothetical protein